MSKRIVLMSMLLTAVVICTCMPASAGDVTINTSGATPFLYAGHSYLPLQSVASFLGAPLLWDSAKGQSVMTYNGQDLALTPGNTRALYKGKTVVLTSPPVVVDGRTYVPIEAFRKYYDVPVEWNGARSEVKIKGPNGWGTARVISRPPWHGGPPPWAPAWGARHKQTLGYYVTSGNQANHKGVNGQSQWQKPHAAPALGKYTQSQGQSKLKGNAKVK